MQIALGFTFHLDSGELSNEDVMITDITRKTIGSTIDLTKYIPIKAGYRFAGWHADKAWKEPIEETMMEKKRIAYAGWEKIK